MKSQIGWIKVHLRDSRMFCLEMPRYPRYELLEISEEKEVYPHMGILVRWVQVL